MAGVGQGLDWGPPIGAICIPFGHKTIQSSTSPLQNAPAALYQNSSVHVNTRSDDIVSCVSRPKTVVKISNKRKKNIHVNHASVYDDLLTLFKPCIQLIVEYYSRVSQLKNIK